MSTQLRLPLDAPPPLPSDGPLTTDEIGALEARGWVLLGERTSPLGLLLYRFGRGAETGLRGGLRRYDETDEMSAGGWRMLELGR